ncbi:MAG: ribosome silencing factor [Candidatus Bipolaricaulota bacterium]|nr:ribosome silencing factor [Candidatus Bipolaricaulota bacterium]MCS7274273.1 ribosome silencing factor [Candidatus Bipolaricaulota bacterium]MDW8111476.1 ribosome silencing factor [Candidatus Bipolaricaulota bacterium]MDW8329381.1 ribosome silencing factor [Candidatus Bipolaricaulota bacterium]
MREKPLPERRLREIVTLIAEKKGEETVILDMREFSIPTDFFVITSGDNPKHVKAIADHLLEKLSATALRSEGWESKNWIVLDYGDLIVHIFQRELRKFYDLEGLWGDAPVRLETGVESATV